MNDEIESIRTNQVHTYHQCERLLGKKWFLKKCNANGLIERYKAHLVVKGYTQKEDADYEETFSLIVRFSLVCLIFAIYTNLNLELYMMDVKTDFLNRELDIEIYMDQLVGFVAKGRAQCVQTQKVHLCLEVVI